MPQIAPNKARKNRISAISITLVALVFYNVLIWKIQTTHPTRFYFLVLVGLALGYFLFRILTAKYRNRSKILNQPFPKDWQKILKEKVHYYNTLSKEEQHRFEQNIQVFLSEKRITGIKTDIDDAVRVLVAASAIIPIFGFKEWEYDTLGEVLIYPNRFSKDFKTEGHGRNVLGMVGTGTMRGIMILSKKALLDGFAKNNDGQNTAIHEFVHLIDAQDGHFDGIPALLDKQYIAPWMNLMYQEIEKIKQRKSTIDPYGATNEVEFFAVASEYFFEKPHLMKEKYPDLYKMLTKIFHQDLTNQFTSQVRDLMNYKGKRIARNAPCPCDSGLKYKQCCLKNA